MFYYKHLIQSVQQKDSNPNDLYQHCFLITGAISAANCMVDNLAHVQHAASRISPGRSRSCGRNQAPEWAMSPRVSSMVLQWPRGTTNSTGAWQNYWMSRTAAGCVAGVVSWDTTQNRIVEPAFQISSAVRFKNDSWFTFVISGVHVEHDPGFREIWGEKNGACPNVRRYGYGNVTYSWLPSVRMSPRRCRAWLWGILTVNRSFK